MQRTNLSMDPCSTSEYQFTSLLWLTSSQKNSLNKPWLIILQYSSYHSTMPSLHHPLLLRLLLSMLHIIFRTQFVLSLHLLWKLSCFGARSNFCRLRTKLCNTKTMNNASQDELHGCKYLEIWTRLMCKLVFMTTTRMTSYHYGFWEGSWSYESGHQARYIIMLHFILSIIYMIHQGPG